MNKISVFLLNSILFCLLLSFVIKGSAQPKSLVDSLIAKVKTTPDDTIKLNDFSDIVDNAPDGIWQQYNELMAALAKKLLKNNNEKVKLAAKKFIAVYNNNLGFEYLEKGDYRTALSYYGESEKVQKEVGDKKELGTVIANIGAVYYRDKDPESALDNYERAIKLFEEDKDFQELISSLANVGKIYFEKYKYDSALNYCKQGLKVAEQNNISNQAVSMLYHDLGSIMEKTRAFDQALEYYNKGLKIGKEAGSKIGESTNLLGIARVYFAKGELFKSIGYARQSLTLAIKVGKAENIQYSSDLLFKIYKKIGNYKEALEMHELFLNTRDSLTSEKNKGAVMQTKFQAAFDKKQDSTKAVQDKIDAVKATELRNQKRIRNYTFGGLVIVVFFLIFVFRQRNRIAKEKHRSEELLLNILPEEVAEELKNTGGAKVKSFDFVTVLFTDFKGFTIISEKLTPEELVAEIDYCFRGFDNIISKHGVEKIKTIGDSYMCAGGVPKANTTNPEDVVNAAIEIRDFILNHKREREAKGEIAFEVRIGVNTGPVVAGIVGVKKFAYDIWGDAVNLASRMESSGEQGKVNISGNTYELVKDKFQCTHRGKILAKGKGDLDMYFVEKI
jgi:adenylate cyclase